MLTVLENWILFTELIYEQATALLDTHPKKEELCLHKSLYMTAFNDFMAKQLYK